MTGSDISKYAFCFWPYTDLQLHCMQFQVGNDVNVIFAGQKNHHYPCIILQREFTVTHNTLVNGTHSKHFLLLPDGKVLVGYSYFAPKVPCEKFHMIKNCQFLFISLF